MGVKLGYGLRERELEVIELRGSLGVVGDAYWCAVAAKIRRDRKPKEGEIGMYGKIQEEDAMRGRGSRRAHACR